MFGFVWFGYMFLGLFGIIWFLILCLEISCYLLGIHCFIVVFQVYLGYFWFLLEMLVICCWRLRGIAKTGQRAVVHFCEQSANVWTVSSCPLSLISLEYLPVLYHGLKPYLYPTNIVIKMQ